MKRATNRGNRRYHGLGGTPTYRTWYQMLDRCNNPSNISWSTYGGKGVKVCERWHDIEAFVADMGIRPEGKTLDRFPNGKGDYEAGNCRWATESQQQRNRGCVKGSMEIARQVRERASNGEGQRQIAASIGIDQSVVCRIVGGKIWLEEETNA